MAYNGPFLGPTVIGAWIGVATRFTFFAGSPAISFIAFLAIAWGFMFGISRYRNSIENSELYKKMQSNSIDWQSVHTRLISDDPAKGLDRDRHKPPIFDRMQNALKTPEKSVYLVSPYFVPTKSGVRALDQLVKNGVDVTVLTNSLQATDVAAVHSGYVKYRKPLLKAGVKLYELQPNHAVPTTKDRGLTGSSANMSLLAA